jgi:thiosulfate dehydrogenase
LLYDKWWKTLELDEPSGDMPLWATQDTNERDGSTTWRCKECHGWDYKGAEGAYASGSHFTGFPGVFDAASKSTGELTTWFDGTANAEHDFSAYLDESAIEMLVAFVQEGLIDLTPYVNDDKTTNGDADNGKTLYDQSCAMCHGQDGTMINFGDADDPVYIGTLANDNPWEFYHKTANGQPGTSMPSGLILGWSHDDIADVVNYAQTLSGEDTEEPSTSSVSAIAVQGGLLYDKWWKALELDEPTGDMPLWGTQDTNERSGTDTWRCKECHGWDYQGAGGAYATGSHFTGFPGVFDASSKSAEELTGWFDGTANAEHDFSTYLDESAIEMLVAFVQEGLTDLTPYVNDDKTTNGDADNGNTLYDQSCAMCHGQDGTNINFHDADDPVYIGELANDNPWEFYHKTAFGQPGTSMPSGVNLGWSSDDIADVVNYAQTLSGDDAEGTSSISPIAVQGGLLYDKWWKALDLDEPNGDMPLWATQDTNERSGTDTWRCKECHGWDYQGVEGAYASGSHLTGFPGVFDASSMSADELTGWFDGTANAEHDFSAYLDESAIEMLVAFIQEGFMDMTMYIGDDKVVTADSTAGKELYNQVCALCHGEDGTTINFKDEDNPVYIGTLANDNPWEFFHKVAYGQPGTPMPSGFNSGWSFSDIAGIVSYAQTLP